MPPARQVPVYTNLFSRPFQTRHMVTRVVLEGQLLRTGEGPEKVTRWGEWEPIKIPLRNVAYIPNSTQRPSLLTQPRPHSYSQAISPRN
jgi:hypothetical protein